VSNGFSEGWEEYVMDVAGVSVENILTVARDAGLTKWTHNARSYELQERLLDTSLDREQMALVAAVCLSRLLPKPPEATG
jgi:hypothetical protein